MTMRLKKNKHFKEIHFEQIVFFGAWQVFISDFGISCSIIVHHPHSLTLN